MNQTKRFSNEVLLNLSDNEVATYILLKSHYDNLQTKEDEQIKVQVSLSGLYYEFTDSFEIPRKLETNLIDGLNKLSNRNIVKVLSTSSKNGKISGNTVLALDITNLRINQGNGEYFSQVDYSELVKLFNIDYKNKFGLLKFACIILGTISQYKEADFYKCGFYSIVNLQEMAKLGSKSTVEAMIKVLEDNDILYVHHSEDVKKDSDGKIKNLPNVYSRVCDKQFADKFYKQKSGFEAHDFTGKLDSDERRAVTMAYNKYVKGKYTDDIIDLVKKCIEWNNQPCYDQHPDWCKDMSVFEPELIEIAMEDISSKAEAKKQERKNKKGEQIMNKTNEQNVNKKSSLEALRAECVAINNNIAKEKKKQDTYIPELTDDEYYAQFNM